MAICKQSTLSALFFCIVLTHLMLSSWLAEACLTIPITTNPSDNIMDRSSDTSVELAQISSCPEPVREFCFVIKKSNSDHAALTGGGAATSFGHRAFLEQKMSGYDSSQETSIWPKLLTTGRGITLESNGGTITHGLIVQISVIVMAESRQYAYADLLLYAMIAGGIIIIVIKWSTMKLLPTGYIWRDWSHVMNTPCPSKEADCTTVATQETTAHDEHSKTIKMQDLIEQ